MDVHRVVFWGRNEATSANSSRLELQKKQTKLEIRESTLFVGVVVRVPVLLLEVGAEDRQKIPLRSYK